MDYMCPKCVSMFMRCLLNVRGCAQCKYATEREEDERLYEQLREAKEREEQMLREMRDDLVRQVATKRKYEDD